MEPKNRFKTPIAAHVFRLKYAIGEGDSWDNLARRVVDSVCGTCDGTVHPTMSEGDRKQLVQYIAEMKFIPGGRYCYYAGRPAKFFNNCFTGDTRVLTDRGWVRFDTAVDQTLNVLSPVDGEYKPAVMHDHGVQPVIKHTFATVRGHQRQQYVVRATPSHRWLLQSGLDTTRLEVGDVVPANEFSAGYSPVGFVHGFVYGDGNVKGQLRLCGKKKKYLAQLSELSCTVTFPPFANGDPLLYYPQDIDWKALPDDTESAAYIASFIHGWLAADGGETAGCKLGSISEHAMLWFREHAAFAGVVISGELRYQVRNIVLGKNTYNNHKLFIQSYAWGEDFPGFKVISSELEPDRRVFCPFEPVHNQIVIDHGIQTYQCYLLRAESDTREEWASVVERSMSCLMTGGGIGIDYSLLRPGGYTLKRTGGKASGPIPLMNIVNEAGRNVMQGGSRRSAIYASLNWQHEDVEEFLLTKNWNTMPIGKAMAGDKPYTLHHAKMEDFNFHAPLDMTNISLNYDDAFLDAGKKLPETFLKNCKQAMRTGEPGFSFNFGAKQNETLRNACTEVCSEDDSDVCNLGSINMGDIESVDEFKDVITLASKFLVCGTIRADLPYAKVYKVREKNRRLGLGLMGIHEWLLKRGSPYEVTPELHRWLEVYEKESKRAADEHCERLYLSQPVAYRAIAPTGSIGILASTTTGIEPLFAVAYKRRYLTEGTHWKYEFVVDSTADHLIKERGVDPEKIQTAYSLSTDYERRIKFQADIQDYVDMSISSTINLPPWGTDANNEDRVEAFAVALSSYCKRLRGFTCYPDGSRGGQPITEVPYAEAIQRKGVVYEENDVCEISGKGGSCGS